MTDQAQNINNKNTICNQLNNTSILGSQLCVSDFGIMPFKIGNNDINTYLVW